MTFLEIHNFKFIKFKCNDYDFIFNQNQVFGFPAKHAKYNIINVTVYWCTF